MFQTAITTSGFQKPSITLSPTIDNTVTPSSAPTDANRHTSVARLRATRTAMTARTQVAELQIATLLALTPSRTPRPTVPPIPTATPSSTPLIETQQARATIEAFASICPPPAVDQEKELSPDGRWMAVVCYGKDDKIDSRLHIVNLRGEGEWVVRYADYADGTLYDRHDYAVPFHWTRDGKYLFVHAPSRFSGCCWVHGDMFLVRVNLRTGQQALIASNMRNERFTTVAINFTISPDDRYVLYVPQHFPGDLFILDLYTWRQRVIPLEFENTGAGHALMSGDGNQVILALQEYPEVYQGDLTYGAWVIIDLLDGSQKRIDSGLEYWDMPLPDRWQDADHVILKGGRDNWLLNVQTAAVTEVDP